MKKIIAVILSITLIISTISICVYAIDDSLKIMVSTDTHLCCYEDGGDLKGVPDEEVFIRGMLNPHVFYYVSQQGQMDYESTAIIQSMLDSFVSSNDKYLLIAGDLTCGKRNSHIKMAEMLKKAEKDSGKQIFVIPGNHDCDEETSDTYIDINEFKNIYSQFGYNESLSMDTDSASYTINLDNKYRLLALDSCIYGSDDGEFSDATLEWIEQEVVKAKNDNMNLVAMMHHSLLPHFAVSGTIKDNKNIAKKFCEWNIKYVFTGHMHANDISSTEWDGKQLIDIQTGSLTTCPNAYRQITFSEYKVDIKTNYVTSIDTSLLPSGYNQEQLDRISSDFSNYSAEFFENGICRWLNRYIGSAIKLGKTLKLTQGSTAYNMLNSIMMKLGDAMALPIYDDGTTPNEIDSLEEIAALSGNSIPKSDYQRLYQVAAAVMGGFYKGDEPEHIKTTEIPLFFSIVKSALAYSITNMLYDGNTQSQIIEAVNNITGISINKVTLKGLSNINFANSITIKILDSILTPLLDGLSEDYSEPGDLNVTLEGYGVNNDFEKVVELNIFKIILNFLKSFFKNLFR